MTANGIGKEKASVGIVSDKKIQGANSGLQAGVSP